MKTRATLIALVTGDNCCVTGPLGNNRKAFHLLKTITNVSQHKSSVIEDSKDCLLSDGIAVLNMQTTLCEQNYLMVGTNSKILPTDQETV